MSTKRDRMPLPDMSLLNQAQVKAIEQITSGPRGALIGPFVPLLRSPELMTRLQLVGEYLRYSGVLSNDLFEVAVLFVARQWNQQFEWGHHYPIAVARGVPKAVLDSIEDGIRPVEGREEFGLVWDLGRGLLVDGGIDDDLFDAAVASLGDQAVIELVVTFGYYTTLALTMNFAATPAPDGAPRMRETGS